MNGDLSFIADTMAEDYVYTNPFGVVISKTVELQGLRTGETAFESFMTDDVKVRVYRGSLAVVNGLVTLKGRARGKDISGQYRYTRVWVRNPKGWQIVSSHFTSVAK